MVSSWLSLGIAERRVCVGWEGQPGSMCIWLHVWQKAAMLEFKVCRHTVSVRSMRSEEEAFFRLWPWSNRRGFITDICLSLSDVPWHRLSCHFTKEMSLPPPPPLLITQSNHSLPTSSDVVQVARLWEETEALLASINVPITTLMWCSPDNKEARAHQSAGKWRRGQSALAAWVVSISRRASDISTSNGF